MIFRRTINLCWLAGAVVWMCAGRMDIRAAADPPARPTPPTNSIVKSTVLGKGEVAWDEIWRQPELYLGKVLRLECQRVRLMRYQAMSFGYASSRSPIPDNSGRYFYGMSEVGFDRCGLVSASEIEAPA